MTALPTFGSPEPYRSPAEHLEDEVRWVRARCFWLAEKLKAQQEADKQALGLVPAEQAGVPPDTKRRLTLLAASEVNIRAAIDGRLQATRAAGIALGFDTICTEFDLDAVDRNAVLLCAIPPLGFELGEVLGTIAAFGYAIMSVTPETVAIFSGLDLAGRIDLRRRLGPDGKIVRGGVVKIEMPRSEEMQDFPGASLFIQAAAFWQIVGLAPDSDAVCFACGGTIPPTCRLPH